MRERLPPASGRGGSSTMIHRASPHYFRLLNDLFAHLYAQPISKFKFNSSVPQGLIAAPGVYVICDNTNVVYVGQSTNVKRRVWEQHRSGRTNGDMFNIYLERRYQLDTVEERSKYIHDYCAFRFLIAEDLREKRIRKLFEAFLMCELDPELNAK